MSPKMRGIMDANNGSTNRVSAERLQALYDGLEEFRKLHPVTTVSLIQTLILVALNEGVSLGELAERGGSRQSTVSRQLIDLTDAARSGEKSLGLVVRAGDPNNLRRNQYTLSDDGRRLLSRVVGLCFGEA